MNEQETAPEVPSDSFHVGPEPIDPALLLLSLQHPPFGAVATFLGRVRSPNAGALVRYLEYEGYIELALTTFGEIADELRELYGPSAWAMQHRLGRLSPGEISLAVLVATPNRAAAFRACETAVEECKRRLPVWKLEVTAGGSHFVPGSSSAASPL